MVQTDAVTTRQRELVAQAIERSRSDFEDRVAVVTGGARGIGKAIAEALLKAGAKVAAADKTWDGSDQFRQQLESSGRGMAILMDVTDDGQLDSAYASVTRRFGTTDVLVNSAALVSETLFAPTGHVKTLDTKDSDWETMFKVNVFGVVKAIRRFVRPMLEKGRGSIINVVSSGVLPISGGGGYFGLRPYTIEMPYQATKAACMALTFYRRPQQSTEMDSSRGQNALRTCLVSLLPRHRRQTQARCRGASLTLKRWKYRELCHRKGHAKLNCGRTNDVPFTHSAQDSL